MRTRSGKFDDHDFMMALLRVCAGKDGPHDFGDILGEEGDTCALERELGLTEPLSLGNGRLQLFHCLHELIRRGLLAPVGDGKTAADRVVTMTAAGRDALARPDTELFIDELLTVPATELVSVRPLRPHEVPWMLGLREHSPPQVVERVDRNTTAIISRLKAASLPGDEIWLCRSRIFDPAGLNGHAGLGLVRAGAIVGYLGMVDY